MILKAIPSIVFTIAALPAMAITIPQSDFVIAREKTATAEYAREVAGVRTSVVSDTDSGLAGTTISAEITPSPADILGVNEGGIAPRIPPGATATSNAVGFTYAIVGGELNNSTEPGTHSISATVTERVETMISPALAGGGTGAFDLFYSFALNDMFVEIWDNSGDALTLNQGLLDYQILVDGVQVWSYEASVIGSRTGTSIGALARITESGGTVTPQSFSITGLPGDAPRRVDFDGFLVTDLFLGSFPGTGASPVIEINMKAEIQLPEFTLGAGARAGIGDPNNLSANFGTFSLETVGTEPTPVPLPMGIWLLITALGGLAGLRKFA